MFIGAKIRHENKMFFKMVFGRKWCVAGRGEDPLTFQKEMLNAHTAHTFTIT